MFFIIWLVLAITLGEQNKAKLDNRPRWMLGGMRDDTGATNPASVYAHGYGLD